MLFERWHIKNRKVSLKHHIEYFNFRCKIQLDLPVGIQAFVLFKKSFGVIVFAIFGYFSILLNCHPAPASSPTFSRWLGATSRRSGRPTPRSRVANNHDHDQIFGINCLQQSIPIHFWLIRPQQHDCWLWHSMMNRIFNSTMILESISRPGWLSLATLPRSLSTQSLRSRRASRCRRTSPSWSSTCCAGSSCPSTSTSARRVTRSPTLKSGSKRISTRVSYGRSRL